ncbi:unnamed protein product [Rhizophagus irregularis]|uniref:Uncharacterized protein n=1 Tax=Rhizophagus irregularis TaxID=588596 RepID=A0A915YVG1_9GLOM|nr:unnamed protein product [Rhizophagus irregularis]CAB5344625.1 unnamed protein product [Rhizophagus irregularis]
MSNNRIVKELLQELKEANERYAKLLQLFNGNFSDIKDNKDINKNDQWKYGIVKELLQELKEANGRDAKLLQLFNEKFSDIKDDKEDINKNDQYCEKCDGKLKNYEHELCNGCKLERNKSNKGKDKIMEIRIKVKNCKGSYGEIVEGILGWEKELEKCDEYIKTHYEECKSVEYEEKNDGCTCKKCEKQIRIRFFCKNCKNLYENEKNCKICDEIKEYQNMGFFYYESKFGELVKNREENIKQQINQCLRNGSNEIEILDLGENTSFKEEWESLEQKINKKKDIIKRYGYTIFEQMEEYAKSEEFKKYVNNEGDIGKFLMEFYQRTGGNMRICSRCMMIYDKGEEFIEKDCMCLDCHKTEIRDGKLVFVEKVIEEIIRNKCIIHGEIYGKSCKKCLEDKGIEKCTSCNNYAFPKNSEKYNGNFWKKHYRSNGSNYEGFMCEKNREECEIITVKEDELIMLNKAINKFNGEPANRAVQLWKKYEEYLEKGFPEGVIDMNANGGYIYKGGRPNNGKISCKCYDERNKFCGKHQHEIKLRNYICLNCQKESNPNWKEKEKKMWKKHDDAGENIEWGELSKVNEQSISNEWREPSTNSTSKLWDEQVNEQSISNEWGEPSTNQLWDEQVNKPEPSSNEWGEPNTNSTSKLWDEQVNEKSISNEWGEPSTNSTSKLWDEQVNEQSISNERGEPSTNQLWDEQVNKPEPSSPSTNSTSKLWDEQVNEKSISNGWGEPSTNQLWDEQLNKPEPSSNEWGEPSTSKLWDEQVNEQSISNEWGEPCTSKLWDEQINETSISNEWGEPIISKSWDEQVNGYFGTVNNNYNEKEWSEVVKNDTRFHNENREIKRFRSAPELGNRNNFEILNEDREKMKKALELSNTKKGNLNDKVRRNNNECQFCGFKFKLEVYMGRVRCEKCLWKFVIKKWDSIVEEEKEMIEQAKEMNINLEGCNNFSKQKFDWELRNGRCVNRKKMYNGRCVERKRMYV